VLPVACQAVYSNAGGLGDSRTQQVHRRLVNKTASPPTSPKPYGKCALAPMGKAYNRPMAPVLRHTAIQHPLANNVQPLSSAAHNSTSTVLQLENVLGHIAGQQPLANNVQPLSSAAHM
jgi:hypothetical protein